MCNFNKTLIQNKTRSLKIVKAIDGSGLGVIRLNKNGQSEDFRVSVAPHYRGDVVDMTWQCIKSRSFTREECFTSLDGDNSTCSCDWSVTFSDVSQCRHIAAGLKLLQLGEIPSVKDYAAEVAEAEMVQAWDLAECY